MSRDGPTLRSVTGETGTVKGDGRRGTFARQVRDALAHLYDPVYLQTHPLAHLVVHDRDSRSSGAGKTLRQVLLDAIESLHPLTGTKDTLPSGTGYQILLLRYVEGLEVPAIQSQLALGKSEYYREQQRALDAITSVLWDQWREGRQLNAETPEAGVTAKTSDTEPILSPARHNLPVPASSFIARVGEMEQVVHRLRESRLLTLTGSGGCGKTRLALEIARACVAEFSDGAWLVELAPLADPSLVPQTITTALGLRAVSDRPLLATLADYLRHRNVLLILDNCEHLVDACAKVVEALLQVCSRLRILATSRELLGIAGEATWRVPSLAVAEPRDPESNEEGLVTAVLHSEAGQLFADRARLVSPSFTVTSETALAVAQVCQRLDGIPLAIELAAARVAILSVDQIAARLDQRFRLLTGGSRTALRRQQTLRATIDWSYQLLSDDERALLRRLAVFAGGWTLEATEAVCAATDGDSGSFEVLDLLTHLAAKSLILVEEATSRVRGARRFRLSETMRQYAEEKLLEAGEAEVMRNRHRDWFVELAERAIPEMEGPNQRQWFANLEAEHDNLRAALAWGLVAPDGREALLRLAAALGRFWQTLGYPQEGIRWLEIALRESETPLHARARALSWLGQLVSLNGNAERARQLHQESVPLARAFGDRRLLSLALRQGNFASVALGDYDEARQLIEEALAVSRECGYKRDVAYNLVALGELLIVEGRLDSAERTLLEGLEVGRQSGDAVPVCHALVDLGGVYLSRGDYARARAALNEILNLERRAGITWISHGALLLLGDLARLEGDLPGALDWYRQLLRRFPLLTRTLLVSALRRYAGVCDLVGAHRRAAQIFGAVSTIHDDPRRFVWFNLQFGFADASVTPEALGEEAFAAAWAEGQTMTLEDAVKLALSEGDSEAPG